MIPQKLLPEYTFADMNAIRNAINAAKTNIALAGATGIVPSDLEMQDGETLLSYNKRIDAINYLVSGSESLIPGIPTNPGIDTVINFIQASAMFTGVEDQPFVITSNSPAPFVLSSSNLAVYAVVNNKLRYVGPGHADITASQIAVTGFNQASAKQTVIATIAKQKVKGTASGDSKNAGYDSSDQPQAGNPNNPPDHQSTKSPIYKAFNSYLDKSIIASFEDYAVSGSTTRENITYDVSKVDARIDHSVDLNFVYTNTGNNGLQIGGQTPSEVYQDIKTWVAARRAAGFNKIIISTVGASHLTPSLYGNGGYPLAISDSLMNFYLAELNARIAAGWKSDIGADGCVAIGEDSHVGILANTSDVNYFGADQLHENDNGYDYKARVLIAPALTQMINSGSCGKVVTMLGSAATISAVKAGNNVVINFSSVDKATNYKIYKGSFQNMDGAILLDTVAFLTYTHVGGAADNNYYFIIPIADGYGQGIQANVQYTAVGVVYAHQSEFNTTNGTLLANYTPEAGNPWIDQTGPFVINGNKVTTTGVSSLSNNWLSHTELNKTDFIADISMTKGAGDTAQIYFRYKNYDTDAYIISWGNNALVLLAIKAGSVTTIKTLTNPPSAGGTILMRIVVNGSNFSLSVNGVEPETAIIEAAQNGTKFVIAANPQSNGSVSFDYVRIK